MIEGIKDFLFENNNTRQIIIKNAFWTGFSQFFCSLVKAAFVIYAARILGAAEYGRMNAALVFSASFLIFSDFGVSTTSFREIGRGASGERIGYFFSLRFLLNLLSLILALACSFYYKSDFFISRVIWIFAFYNLLNGCAAIISSYFSAKRLIQYSAIVDSIGAFVSAVFGFFLLRIHATATTIAICYCAGAATALIIYLLIFFRMHQGMSLKINFSVWREILWKSTPFAIIGILSILCSNIDIFILGILRKYESIGLYSAAFKIISFAAMPMSFIAASFFPSLNSLFCDNREQYKRVIGAELEIALVLGLAISYGGYILAWQIIDFVYDQRFLQAVQSFKYFSALVLPMFLASPLSHMAIIEDRQKILVRAWVISFAVNILLDLALIPKFLHVGGAIATLCANIAFILFMYFYLQQGRLDSIFGKKFLWLSSFSIASCVVMHSVAFTLSVMAWNLAIVVIFAGLSYLGFYIILRRLFLGSFTG